MKSLYVIWGKVVEGASRGKRLGFPTANIALHKKIPEGIYAAEVFFQNKKYIAAVFVGSPKTFSEKDYKLEAYLLDFKDNLYEKTITVRIYRKIRGNKRFNSPQELSTQMKRDVLNVRGFFSK